VLFHCLVWSLFQQCHHSTLCRAMFTHMFLLLSLAIM
jgi:hypothetical protein